MIEQPSEIIELRQQLAAAQAELIERDTIIDQLREEQSRIIERQIAATPNWRLLLQLLEAASTVWSFDSQADQAAEECAQLITTLMHERRNKLGVDNTTVRAKAADVTLMALQMLLNASSSPEEAAAMLTLKMQRFEDRLRQQSPLSELRPPLTNTSPSAS